MGTCFLVYHKDDHRPVLCLWPFCLVIKTTNLSPIGIRLVPATIQGIHHWSYFRRPTRTGRPTDTLVSHRGDPLSNVQVEFATKEEAIEFCEKNGWDWSVDLKTPVKPKVKSYGANFSWNRNTRTSTK